MYFVLAFDVFIFFLGCIYHLWVVCVRGRHYVFLFLLLFLVSHMLHWLLIYIMSLFMVYVLFYVLWNQEFTLFYLYFPHMRLCVC